MSGPIRLIPRLSKAARALLEWQQQDLATASGVPKPTISAFEARGGDAKLATLNNQAAVAAFEKAGLEFIPENGGGAGIRFRTRAESTQRGRGTSANDSRDATLEREIESNPGDWD